MTNLLSHWIGGAPSRGTSDRTAPVHNPATGDITNAVLFGSVSDVDAAVVVAGAIAAFPASRPAFLTPRRAIHFKFSQLLNARKGELAEIITAEPGNVLAVPPRRDSAVIGWSNSLRPASRAAWATCSTV